MMRYRDWDRTARITEVRDQIWKYLSPASRFEGQGLLDAGALLQWSEDDASRLGELQFLLCRETGEFLKLANKLIRKLATTSEPEEERTGQRLRGPVQWNRTLSLRSSTGNQQTYYTTPARRVFQTPENELMVHVLDAIVTAAQHSGWSGKKRKQEAVAEVRDRLDRAESLLAHPQLSGIDRVSPRPRAVARVRCGRHAERYRTVLSAYDKFTSLVEQVDRQAVREAVEEAGLVTAEEFILFELLTTFRVIDSLKSLGWRMGDLGLFRGQVHTTGQRPDRRQVDLWYQSTPPVLADCSLYRQVAMSHHFRRADVLRPDIVVHWMDSGGEKRWLLIECKLSLSRSRGVERAARDALGDLLAYRADFAAALGATKGPHCLGVAWGEGLQPVCTSDIVLCTPDTLQQAIQQIIK